MGQGSKTSSLPRLGDAEATIRVSTDGALGAYAEIVAALAMPAAVLTPAGLILAANPGLAEGLAAADLSGEPFLAYIARASERSAFGRAFTGLRGRPAGHNFSLELTLVPGRGRAWPCAVRASKLASDNVLLTFTAPERSQTPDVGRSLARCLEALDQGLLLLDGAGMIVHANPAARALFAGEVRGRVRPGAEDMSARTLPSEQEYAEAAGSADMSDRAELERTHEGAARSAAGGAPSDGSARASSVPGRGEAGRPNGTAGAKGAGRTPADGYARASTGRGDGGAGAPAAGRTPADGYARASTGRGDGGAGAPAAGRTPADGYARASTGRGDASAEASARTTARGDASGAAAPGRARAGAEDMSGRPLPSGQDSEARSGPHLGGRSLLELAEPAVGRALSEALTQARVGNWHGEIELRRLDGAPLPVELSLAGGREEGAPTVALLRDLRERRQQDFEDRLLAQVDRLLVSTARPHDNVAAACGAIMDSLGFTRGVVLARVGEGWQRWSLRTGCAPRISTLPVEGDPPAAWGSGPAVVEIDATEPTHRRWFGDLEGRRTALRMALGANPRVAGYFVLVGAGPRDAPPVRLLALLAPQLALGLEGGRLMIETEALAAYQALLLDQTSVLINSIDAAGRVVTWNRASQQLLGVSAEAARGRKFGVEVARLAEPARWDSLWASLRKAGAIATEVAVLAEGGKEIPLHLEGRLLRGADDPGAGAVLVALDLRRRRALEDQVLRTQKLAAVGLLAAGIAHEINNPLSGVVGYSRLLLEKPLDPGVREKVEKIAASGERCRKIVEGVLLFSRQREGGKRRPVDLSGLIDRVIGIGEYQWRMHNVRILRSGLPTAMLVGDADQLEQVLLNLLSNAVDAMPRGGRIRIRLDREDGRVVVEIADEGCGIPPEILDRIFDPFFSTKDIGKGTGLGLAISYGIIKDHGGDILVRSQPGQGTTFTIHLPDAPEGQPTSV
ncbi:ATP-binding protein [Nannocystis punicea]|uniref:histidine kinase n=1 Tax=Nannocystis punicea TaxID=2995304 RepID=A0ABY7HHX2_9BACT|nr:ATP-binding protein [Nannocystis poenicansa]WAS98923.1 ATP-binding protein [Nannocystis poenicansa]